MMHLPQPDPGAHHNRKMTIMNRLCISTVLLTILVSMPSQSWSQSASLARWERCEKHAMKAIEGADHGNMGWLHVLDTACGQKPSLVELTPKERTVLQNSCGKGEDAIVPGNLDEAPNVIAGWFLPYGRDSRHWAMAKAECQRIYDAAHTSMAAKPLLSIAQAKEDCQAISSFVAKVATMRHTFTPEEVLSIIRKASTDWPQVEKVHKEIVALVYKYAHMTPETLKLVWVDVCVHGARTLVPPSTPTSPLEQMTPPLETMTPALRCGRVGVLALDIAGILETSTPDALLAAVLQQPEDREFSHAMVTSLVRYVAARQDMPRSHLYADVYHRCTKAPVTVEELRKQMRQ